MRTVCLKKVYSNPPGKEEVVPKRRGRLTVKKCLKSKQTKPEESEVSLCYELSDPKSVTQPS